MRNRSTSPTLSTELAIIHALAAGPKEPPATMTTNTPRKDGIQTEKGWRPHP